MSKSSVCCARAHVITLGEDLQPAARRYSALTAALDNVRLDASARKLRATTTTTSRLSLDAN